MAVILPPKLKRSSTKCVVPATTLGRKCSLRSGKRRRHRKKATCKQTRNKTKVPFLKKKGAIKQGFKPANELMGTQDFMKSVSSWLHKNSSVQQESDHFDKHTQPDQVRSGKKRDGGKLVTSLKSIQQSRSARSKEFRKFFKKNSHLGFFLAMKKFKKRQQSKPKRVKTVPARTFQFQAQNFSDSQADVNVKKCDDLVPLSISMKSPYPLLPPFIPQEASPSMTPLATRKFDPSLTKASTQSTVVSSSSYIHHGFEHSFDDSTSIPMEKHNHDLVEKRDVCFIFAMLDREKDEALLKCSPQIKSSQVLKQFLSVVETVADDNDLLISKKLYGGDVNNGGVGTAIFPSRLISRGTSPVSFSVDVEHSVDPEACHQDTSCDNCEAKETVDRDALLQARINHDSYEYNIDAATKVIISKALLTLTAALKRHVDICVRFLCWCSENIKGDIDSDSIVDEFEGFLCHCHDQVSLLLQCLSILDRRYILNVDEAEVARLWLLHDAIACILQAYQYFKVPACRAREQLVSLMVTCAKMIIPDDKLSLKEWTSLLKMVQDIGREMGEESTLPYPCQCSCFFVSLRGNRLCRVCDVKHMHQAMCQTSDMFILKKNYDQLCSTSITPVQKLFPRLCSFLETVEEWSEKKFRSASSVHSVVKFTCNKQCGLYPCDDHLIAAACQCFGPRKGPLCCAEENPLLEGPGNASSLVPEKDIQMLSSATPNEQNAASSVCRSANEEINVAEGVSSNECAIKSNQNLLEPSASSLDVVTGDSTVSLMKPMTSTLSSLCGQKSQGGRKPPSETCDPRSNNFEIVSISSGDTNASSDMFALHLDDDCDDQLQHPLNSLQTQCSMVISSRVGESPDTQNHVKKCGQAESKPQRKISEVPSNSAEDASNDSVHIVSHSDCGNDSDSAMANLKSPDIKYSSSNLKEAKATFANVLSRLSQESPDMMSRPNLVEGIANGGNNGGISELSKPDSMKQVSAGDSSECIDYSHLCSDEDLDVDCQDLTEGTGSNGRCGSQPIKLLHSPTLEGETQSSVIMLDNSHETLLGSEENSKSPTKLMLSLPSSPSSSNLATELPSQDVERYRSYYKPLSSVPKFTESMKRKRQGNIDHGDLQKQARTDSPSFWSTLMHGDLLQPKEDFTHQTSEQLSARRVTENKKVSRSTRSRLSLKNRCSPAKVKIGRSPIATRNRSNLSSLSSLFEKPQEQTPQELQETKVATKVAGKHIQDTSEGHQDGISNNKSILKMPESGSVLKSCGRKVTFATDENALPYGLKSSHRQLETTVLQEKKQSMMPISIRGEHSKSKKKNRNHNSLTSTNANSEFSMGASHSRENMDSMNIDFMKFKPDSENSQKKEDRASEIQSAQVSVTDTLAEAKVASGQEPSLKRKKGERRDKNHQVTSQLKIEEENENQESPLQLLSKLSGTGGSVLIPISKRRGRKPESRDALALDKADAQNFKSANSAERFLEEMDPKENGKDRMSSKQRSKKKVKREPKTNITKKAQRHNVEAASQNSGSEEDSRGCNDSYGDWNTYISSLRNKILKTA